MADESAGKISVDIIGNEKPLKKTVENLGNTLQKPLGKLGAAMAAAFSAAAVIKFGKESVEAAAEVNAANSQMTQTFGELESTAKSVIQGIAKESGIMETRLQGVGTSIYAFAKTSGMDSASAMSLMQDALQATADSAAYYDRSLEETAESLKSFLKGNYANDAALGISCTETTRNTAANKLYGKSFSELSEAQKQLTLLQMVKDANALSGAMGQAAREADGWENVTGNLKEAWRQFQAVVGQPILKIATTVVKQLTGALQQLTVYAKTATEALGKLFGIDMSDLDTSASSTSASMSEVADGADESTDNIKKTTKAAEKLKKTVAGFDQLNILSDNSDSSDDSSTDNTSSDTALSMPAPDTSKTEAAIDGIGKKLDGLKKKLKNIYDQSPLKSFVDNFRKQFDKINFDQIGKNFKSIFNSMKPIAQASLNGLKKIFSSWAGYVGTIIGGIVRTVTNVIQTVTGGIAKWLAKDKERIAGFITAISDNISGGIDNIAEFAGTIFDALNDSIERMRPQTEQAISDMLSGFTTFAGSVTTVVSDAFRIATGVVKKWATDNKDKIGQVFDGVQSTVNQVMTGIGNIFNDLGKQLSTWWTDSGASTTFENICGVIADIGTAALDLCIKVLKPAMDNIFGKLQGMWSAASPIFGSVLDLIKAVGDYVVAFWNDYLKPTIDLIIENVSPIVDGVIDVVVGALQGMWETLCGIVNGIIEVVTGIVDFLTGVFTGDWKKAWEGIKKILKGIVDAIVGFFKGMGTTISNLFNGLVKIVYGVIKLLLSRIVQIFTKIGNTVKNVFNAISGVAKKAWNSIVNTYTGIGKWFGDKFKAAWKAVTNVWNGAGKFFNGIWSAIKKAFGTAKTWLVNQFKGAWESVTGLFEKGGKIFVGIKDSLGNIFKTAVNGLIDGINWVISQPINNLNNVLKSIKGVDIMGAKPFDWINTIPVPKIPKLAKGGLVTAPTLALVGDNKGAAHDPEVVSPLSKLESIMNSNDPEIIRLLMKIIALLENDEITFYNINKIDSEEIERKLVKVRRRKQRRYGGAATI